MGRGNLEGVDFTGSTVDHKEILRGCGLDSFGSAYGQVVGSCEYSNKPLGCIEAGNLSTI